MKKLLIDLLRDEQGQSLTEYALIIALVSIALIATVTLFKDKLLAVFTDINDGPPRGADCRRI